MDIWIIDKSVRYEGGKGKIYYRLRDFLNTDAL